MNNDQEEKNNRPEKIPVSFEIQILSDISRIANSDTHLQERLDLIISIIKERTIVDACSILLIDDENENLIFKATKGMSESVINILNIPINTGLAGWTAREKKPVAVSDSKSDSRFKSMPETGEDKFESVLTAPLITRGNCIGIIYTQNLKRREYHDKDVQLLCLIADQISGIIRNAQLYERSVQNLDELFLLNEITRALNSAVNLDDLLSLIVRRSSEIVNAKRCVLWIASGEVFLPKAYCGIEREELLESKVKIGSCDICSVSESGEPILIKDIQEHEDCGFLHDIGTKSALCIPLVVKSKIMGVLSLFDKLTTSEGEYTHFSELDQRVISVLGGQAAIAIDKAMVSERLEQVNQERMLKIDELSLLYDVSVAMQSTISLEKVIKIILSCVTVGEIFGFNRAILFLVNERTKTLEGQMGLGPDSAEEANSIWKTIPEITNLVEWLITQEEAPIETGKQFNEFSRSLNIPIKKDSSILAQTIIDGKHFNVQDARAYPGVNQELLEKLGSNSFATVPLIAQDQVLGAILVDNLYTGKKITDEDVQSLVRFASHVGYAVQNIRLYNRLNEANKDILAVQNYLIQAEKFSALGELTAEIADEIKNPLMVVGGFARRLAGNGSLSKEEISKYSEIITKEVERTEHLLNEILVHSRFTNITFSECDINSLIHEIVSFYELALTERGINIVRNLSSDINKVVADTNQLKHVITNMIHNSIEAMPNGGTLFIGTWELPGGTEGVCIAIEDTGVTISQKDLDDMMLSSLTPGKGKVGLGLHLSKRMINTHGGKINIKKRKEGGTVFTITIPYNRGKLETKGGGYNG